ncbi:MAG TPA: hypothetical protein DCS29_03235 [Candidatus Magasanikbacteria bacterium]|nr:MAG: hypothetical protein A2479_02835 [Candidatus Magasanikbacteria bacterium RIFOXYC2_FULL_39_8]HAT03759.1 hypothetical protein [Candidatus Magasanikbacteria bacterium]
MHTTRNILFIVALIFLLGLGVFYIFFFMKKPMPIQQTNNDIQQVDTTNKIQQQIQETTGMDVSINLDDFKPSSPKEMPEWYATDKDEDGLTDEEEQRLGTNVWEPDSDGDGLPDKVEIEKYKTDPMKPDSDGDTYWDGLEITNGYNPLGEGKI